MTKENKEKIAKAFIRSENVRDFVLQEDLSDMDLTMMIIQQSYLNISKIKSHLNLIQDSGLDFLYDYYRKFLNWYHDFIANDGTSIYFVAPAQRNCPENYYYCFTNYEDAIKNLDAIRDDEYGIMDIVKKTMGMEYFSEYISLYAPDEIVSHSFMPENYDEFYSVNVSSLFHTHDIVRNIFTGDYAIVTRKPNARPGATSSDMSEYFMITEGFRDGNVLWYDHADPYIHEVIEDGDPEFLKYPSSKLLLEMKRRCGKSISFYDKLTFFKDHHIRLAGIDG